MTLVIITKIVLLPIVVYLIVIQIKVKIQIAHILQIIQINILQAVKICLIVIVEELIFQHINKNRLLFSRGS